MQNQTVKTEKKLGEQGYVNKNCWLARNVGYPPSKRCQFCELKFRNCMFERYLVVTLVLVGILLVVSYSVEKNISRLFIFTIFLLVISYGYFFSKSTEKIIISHFEEKKAKNAFKDLSDNLQQKVDEQTKDIKEAYEMEKKAREDLQELDKTKNEFMLIIQHHLRTPLAGMRWYTDFLLSGKFGKLAKKNKEVAQKLGDSTGDLIKVVEEFLDLSQFQIGEKVVIPKPGVDVKAILESIVKDLSFESEKKGIDIIIKDTKENIQQINADSGKLKIAISNIVDNAIKYTEKGGVKIEIENKQDAIKIIIKDTGIGMQKEEIDKLFSSLFIRGQGAKKFNVTGRGIGLYLSAKIIEAHHGKIWAESEGEGKGSTFYIELPIE